MIKHCPQLRQELKDIKSQYDAYVLALEQAKTTKEYEQALSIQPKLIQATLELGMKVNPDKYIEIYLTEIERKSKANIPLTKAEIIFLYDARDRVSDPRIVEILKTRNPKEDAPIVFDYQPNEIAYDVKEVNKNTKAYIGLLFPGIFEIELDNIYTSFPEGRIKKQQIVIGDKNKDQLEAELKEKYKVSSYAQVILDKAKIITLEKAENMELVVLTVTDLGFPQGATTEQIYQKARELGLDLCPAEVGPQLRLQYDQPIDEYLLVAMEPIVDADGCPKVFYVNHHRVGGRWLRGDDAKPDHRWHASAHWVFARRK